MTLLSPKGLEPIVPRVWSANAHGAHPDVLAALTAAHLGANRNGLPPYGNDTYSRTLSDSVRGIFGSDAHGYLLGSGTGANAVILSVFADSTSTIITPSCSHIAHFEAGAIEYATNGARIRTVETTMGKISVQSLEWALKPRTSLLAEQQPRPRVLVVSQLTELGTAYSVDELRQLAACAHAHGMKFVVDGARLFSAVANSRDQLRSMTTDVGADAVSLDFGKNGGDGCLAVFLSASISATDVRAAMKQAGFARSAGFADAAAASALLEGGLWRELAQKANVAASSLCAALNGIGLAPAFPVDGNVVFVRLPEDVRSQLAETDRFYTWDRFRRLARFETSFTTSDGTISALVHEIGSRLAQIRHFEESVERLSASSPEELSAMHTEGHVTDELFLAAWDKLLDRFTVPQLHALVQRGVVSAAEMAEVLMRAGVGIA